MDQVHRTVARVAGEISLALVRRTATRRRMLGWAVLLEQAAEMLRRMAGE